MPRQGTRSDGEESGEKRRENWRTDKNRPNKRSNKNTDLYTESPSKKMKSGPTSGTPDMARSMDRDNPDLVQSIKLVAEGVNDVKTILEAVLEEKREGPSLSSSRNQTLHGGEAQDIEEHVLAMLPISSKEDLKHYDEFLGYRDYRKALNLQMLTVYTDQHVSNTDQHVSYKDQHGPTRQQPGNYTSPTRTNTSATRTNTSATRTNTTRTAKDTPGSHTAATRTYTAATRTIPDGFANPAVHG
ncbi:uncharacterized protein LOC135157649 [Lytechinus pictus]|uniref:uncharacterized protein LOC135157649 n=1 Tax=Lytechinus pictus TaxID=7653 RepID=UPI0030B9DAE7